MLNMLILQSAKLGPKRKEEKAKFRQIADNQAKMFSKGQRLNYRPLYTIYTDSQSVTRSVLENST